MTQSLILGLILKCSYSVFNAPFASVEYAFTDDGRPVPQATVTQYGKSQVFRVRENATSANEKWNLTLAPNDPQSELGVKIFHSAEKGYTSILINEKSPIGKEMQGTCQ